MSNYDYYCILLFTVFVILVNNLIISTLSLMMESYSVSDRYPAVYRRESQNFVSFASFRAIVSFVKKSALLCAYWLYAVLAPTLVPLRTICFNIS